MSEKNYKAEIWDALSKFAILFDKPPTAERLQAYCSYLSKYPPQALSDSLSRLVRETHMFPSLKTILDLLEPQSGLRDKSVDMAGTILVAVRMFGWSSPEKAKEKLGEIAWNAVQLFGGWRAVCEVETKDLGTVRAQLRDLCVSGFQKKEDLRRETLVVGEFPLLSEDQKLSIKDNREKIRDIKKEKEDREIVRTVFS